MSQNNVNSFIAGSITGITEVIFGYPLDTLKVNLQNRSLDTFNFNIKNLYTGCSYPLFTNSILISLEFGVFNYFRNQNHSITVSGIYTGAVTGLVMTPIDRCKIRKQTFSSSSIYNKPFKGLPYVLAREMPATAIYFNSYYYLKEKMPIIVAGGLAGVITWSVAFPLDVIKTRMQSDKYNTLKEALIFKGIYNGIVPCLIRALFINSISFYTYEYTLQLLNR